MGLGRTLETGTGVVFTPPDLARRIVRGTRGGRGHPAPVLDPACGDGELLLAALEAAGGDPEVARTGLFGIELRADLAARTRDRLRRAAGLPEGTELERHVVTADALDPGVAWPGGTWIVANPPWVSYSGREAALLDSSERQRLRERSGVAGWPTLQGAFLERIAAHVADEGTGARVLLPAALTELPGYASLRRAVARRTRLPEPPEELGQAIPGVVGEVVLVTLEPGPSEELGGIAWNRPGGEESGLIEALERFPRLPERTFADPGVHTGNSARELIVRARGEGAPVREGRCLHPFQLEPARAGLRLGVERTPERRFRLRDLDHYRSFPILVRQTADRPIAALHEDPTYFRNSLLAAREVEGLDPAFVVGVLNGPVATAWHRARFRDARQRAFPQVKVFHLASQPFPIVHRDQAPELHDGIARRVRALRPGGEGFRRACEAVGQCALEAFGLRSEHAGLACRIRRGR